MDPGLHEEFVQWGTFRGSRTFITNVSQEGADGLGDTVGAYERNKVWVSSVVTHSFWFSRFMSGLHKRVGEVRQQDEPVTIEVLREVGKILEGEWRRASDTAEKRRVAEIGVWFVAGFCTGLRGEEKPLIEFAGTAKSLKFLGDPECPHFILVILGQTKGVQLAGFKFGIPCAATTEETHMKPGRWV
jgi:hypothetical protein